MLRSRLSLFGLVAGLAAATAACGSVHDDGATAAQAFWSPNANILGTIQSGETEADCTYDGSTRDAWAFTANGGDVVTVTVSSTTGGDAVGYLTDKRYDVLAYNDDATPQTKNAQVVYTVPDGAGQVELLIVFEDYNHVPGTFDVSLDIQGDGGAQCDPGRDGLDYWGTPAQCQVLRYQCPSGEVPFSNDCGCGCETMSTSHRP